ncbi:hypothetical protein K461DRAFT_93254 [Myriangium duriaei CBS 260.36]|uniref:Uncharacterized protein n=1 Tax=Myriangium duriaei CBS 260.36 TaxID=1168546 RepID=A0A9P4JCB6_9PEZI|nr:hypothetical protein K461DRAFT_93254 [Myriangium duriaei CBS 260.36]
MAGKCGKPARLMRRACFERDTEASRHGQRVGFRCGHQFTCIAPPRTVFRQLLRPAYHLPYLIQSFLPLCRAYSMADTTTTSAAFDMPIGYPIELAEAGRTMALYRAVLETIRDELMPQQLWRISPNLALEHIVWRVMMLRHDNTDPDRQTACRHMLFAWLDRVSEQHTAFRYIRMVRAVARQRCMEAIDPNWSKAEVSIAFEAGADFWNAEGVKVSVSPSMMYRF